MSNILITICARGGSVGIPKKNIKKVNNLPLIVYSIQTAQAYSKKHNAKIAISSDDPEILNVAKNHGLTTDYIRSLELSGSEVGKVLVLEDLLKHEEKISGLTYDYLIDLDVTSPLRSVLDIENAFETLSSSNAHNIFSVSKAHRNPYFNMVEKEKNQEYVKLIKPDNHFMTRQSAPEVYDMNASFYIYKKSFFEQQFKSSITPKSLAYVMNHICFDIDEPLDLLMMEFLISNEHLDFEL